MYFLLFTTVFFCPDIQQFIGWKQEREDPKQGQEAAHLHYG